MTTVAQQLVSLGTLYDDGRSLELPMTAQVEELARSWILDDRFPQFSMWELRYTNGGRAPGRLWLPQGGALAAKLDTLVTVVGPWRVRMGFPFPMVGGGRFDPVHDAAGKRVTHRKKDKRADDWLSQHQFRPQVWDRYPTRARGTAWDVSVKNDLLPSNDDLAWFNSLETPDGRKVSWIVYHAGRGEFVHLDLRPGRPYRTHKR